MELVTHLMQPCDPLVFIPGPVRVTAFGTRVADPGTLDDPGVTMLVSCPLATAVIGWPGEVSISR